MQQEQGDAEDGYGEGGRKGIRLRESNPGAGAMVRAWQRIDAMARDACWWPVEIGTGASSVKAARRPPHLSIMVGVCC
ncbi:hypothetical protein [Kitasatospora sp. NPDC058492]|uniref:hypothetical protein n=1 Tax=Kitasatospora sp. NPDC058492 TaxID=3346527 RepID=UPI0036562544